MKKHALLSALSFLFILQAPAAFAEKVEVTLVNQPNGYCLDAAGGNRNIDIIQGLTNTYLL